MLTEGHSRRAIARRLGWGFNTGLRYANAARWQDTIRDNRPRPSRLDPCKPCLERRFAEGCTSVTPLHSELVAEQAPVTYGMVRAHIATVRAVPAEEPPRPPTVRQVTGWLTRHPTALTEEDRAGLKDVLARCPELDTASGHVRDFGEILTDRPGCTLPTWIDAVDASQLPGLTGFALHLLRDLDAVTAGLTLDWSSGSIEGAVNRIKKIKRQLYGRAGFELLRKMILLQCLSATATPDVAPETPSDLNRQKRGPTVGCEIKARAATCSCVSHAASSSPSVYSMQHAHGGSSATNACSAAVSTSVSDHSSDANSARSTSPAVNRAASLRSAYRRARW
ncbi:transposase [Streptomyces sp. NRRL F-525]|uniref:transposase n=1 Tax=Streptomyces sp. NRRL F-525 TaxID=1463861 RepID=UPI002D21A678|nr:transposase [Streptomyces sp. NRRL F-525]